ncbi:MAG: hypothetical protein U9Q03_04565 [Patescibacteria group bacterium]|nr:hypothetical protein [Patescibacteria group bacterium]
MKRLPLLAIACTCVIVLLAVVGSVIPQASLTDDVWYMDRMDVLRNDGDLNVFYTRAAWVDEGGIPYSHAHAQEYPPLAVAMFALVRLLTSSAEGFSVVMIAVMIAHYAALVFVTGRILAERSLPYTRLWFFVLPGLMYFTLWRYDVIPALWTTVAIGAVFAGVFGVAFLALVVGTLYKVYPGIFLLPLFMLVGSRVLSGTQRASLAKWLSWSALITLVVCGGFALFAGFADMIAPLAFHMMRDVERGSLPSALLALLPMAYQDGARPFVIAAMLLCQFVPFVVLTAKARVRTKTEFVHACLFILIPLTVFARFFSPQWILWITPLVLLVANRRALLALLAFDLLIYLQFPVLFTIDPFHISYDLVTILRTVVLLWIWHGSARAILSFSQGHIFALRVFRRIKCLKAKM